MREHLGEEGCGLAGWAEGGTNIAPPDVKTAGRRGRSTWGQIKERKDR